MNELPLLVNDKQFKRIVKQATKYVHSWQTTLGLHQWFIQPEFTIDEKPDKDDSCIGESTCAKVHTMWQYEKANITFYVAELLDMTNEELEKCVLHELCHVLVHEMRCWNPSERLEEDVAFAGIQHEERVVTNLTNAFWWTKEEGFKNGARSIPVAPKRKYRTVKNPPAKGKITLKDSIASAKKVAHTQEQCIIL